MGKAERARGGPMFGVQLFDLGHVWNATLDRYVAATGDDEFFFFGPVVSVWLMQVSTYVVCGVLFTLLDVYRRPGALYKFKIQGKYAYAVDGSELNPSLAWTLGLVAVAFAAELPALIGFQWLCGSIFGTGVRTVYAAPGWLEIGFAIVVLTLLSEVGFYFSHRLLHEVPFLYRHVHKYHHQFRTPIALAAEAQHPLEMVLCTAWGMTFWPFLLGTHAQVLAIGTAIGTFSSMSDHCGYWFFGNGIQPFFHDWHHERNAGNYGFLGLMDGLFGTSAKWKEDYERRKEAMRAGNPDVQKLRS